LAGARSSFLAGLAVLTTAYHTTPSARPGQPIRSEPHLLEQAVPAPLDAEEAASAAGFALARRFNPAMAFPIPDIWPVEVRYAWHDGADLMAHVDGGPTSSYLAVPGSSLGVVDWSDLPHHTPDGRAIRYYVDAPGDDRPTGPGGLSSWRQRWRQIVQPAGLDASPAASPYPPTQYAHVFWLNRARGLLAITYWFYYPYNEWVNRHEGDWERVQVVLEGPPRLTEGASFVPVAHQFFFHGRWSQPPRVVRLGGPDPGEDHPLVYVGGKGRFLAWSGVFSGASYPLPARYIQAGSGMGPLNRDEEVPPPARFIAARDFRVILLPEPGRLDGRQSPELSWLRLPFYAGQRSVHTNPPGYRALGHDQPPVQPAARPSWLQPPRTRPWSGQIVPGLERSDLRPWPRAWACARPDDPASCPVGPDGPFAALSAVVASEPRQIPGPVQ
jgi:hypothetical protein